MYSYTYHTYHISKDVLPLGIDREKHHKSQNESQMVESFRKEQAKLCRKTVINRQERKRDRQGGTTHVVLSLEFAFTSLVETPKCLPGGSYLNSFECVETCYRAHICSENHAKIQLRKSL